MIVAIIGVGTVGLALAVAAAPAVDLIWGLDISEEQVEFIRQGRSPVSTVTAAQLRRVRPTFSPTTNPACLSDCSVIAICVPTLLGPTDEPDLTALQAAIEVVGRHLRRGQLVIVESTVAPGTTEGLVLGILNRSGLTAGKDYNLAHSPERIDPGNERYNVGNTTKVVGGLTPRCTDRAAQFYSMFIERVHCTRGIREAEAAKTLENAYRHVNIALINEFMRACDVLDVDGWDVIEAASTKPFGFHAFRPSAGAGGTCVPVAPMLLAHRARETGAVMQVVEAAHRVNKLAPTWVADRTRSFLREVGLSMTSATVLLLGVTYKANVTEIENSPALPLAIELHRSGATVWFHDPYVESFVIDGDRLTRVCDLGAALDNADLTILVQPHWQYDSRLLSRCRRLLVSSGDGQRFSQP